MTLSGLLSSREPVDAGIYEFTAERIIEFAGTFDPHFFHLDAEKARTSLFGGLCASGWQVCAAAQKCTVDYLNSLAGPPGPTGMDFASVHDLKWLRPVFAGDVVRFTIARNAELTDPDGRLTGLTCEGTNQDGLKVIRFVGTIADRTGP
jgi:acyl dehydratase